MEGILLDTMFDLPSLEGVEEVVISREVVEGTARPLYIYADRAGDAGATASPDGVRSRDRACAAFAAIRRLRLSASRTPYLLESAGLLDTPAAGIHLIAGERKAYADSLNCSGQGLDLAASPAAGATVSLPGHRHSIAAAHAAGHDGGAQQQGLLP